jgi:PAS domain S-box-containing protein
VPSTRKRKSPGKIKAVTPYNPEFIQTILAYLPVVIWSIDAKGIFTLVEGLAIRNSGITASDIIGKSIFDLYGEFPEIILATNRVLNGEAVSYTTEMTDLVYECRYTPLLDSKGKVKGAIGVAIESSERVRSERELSDYTKRLFKSYTALEEFSQTASHDLKEPVRNMLTYLELLKKEFSNQISQNALTYLDFALKGAKQMEQLIQKLLAEAKLSQYAEDFTAVDCAEVIEKTKTNLKMLILETQAEIRVQTLPRIFGNEIQLIQVFQNLISNAIKFKSDELPIIEISSYLNGDEWVVVVKDNGVGFEEEAKHRIFSLYQRLQRTHGRPGLGIGLAIARRIIEYHGGRIWAESKLGEGSKFFLSFPVLKSA